MNEIRVQFDIAPTTDEQEVVGSYVYHTPNDINESSIHNVLKKSIARLQLSKQKVIVVLLDIFVNDQKQYEAGIWGVSSLININIKKVD